MTNNRLVYLFRGSEMLVQTGFEASKAADKSILDGIPADIVLQTFKNDNLDYFDVPSIDKTSVAPCFFLKKTTAIPQNWQSITVREIAALVGAGKQDVAQLLLRACHIMQWRSDSVFCGACGAKNQEHPKELARLCPCCGRVEYPRVAPAIIVLITNDADQALLAHNRSFQGGIYSLIAGFNEAGETLEATVSREVKEEVGLEVGNIRYVASQSWPFPNSLMIGWTARHAGGAIQCDGVEIEDAGWFSRDALPPLPGHGSIARRIIEGWLCGENPCGNAKMPPCGIDSCGHSEGKTL